MTSLASQQDISGSSDLLSSSWSRSQGALVTHQTSAVWRCAADHTSIGLPPFPFCEAAMFHRKDGGLTLSPELGSHLQHTLSETSWNHSLPLDSFSCSAKQTMC